MPNIWAHLLFGQEALREAAGHGLPADRILDDAKLRNLFNLGCQGPDLLFYHNFVPWKTDKKMPRLGSAMHARECGPVLIGMVGRMAGKPLYDPAAVYVLGFLMHHVLDRNVHPYVFYRSGFRKWDHQRFEVAMDTLIVRRKLGMETYRTPVWKQFDIGGTLPEGVAEMLAELSRQWYPELTANVTVEDWHQSYRDMVGAQKLFYDPSGIRRLLTFGQIAPLVYKRHVPPYDYLNESRTEWRHPALYERVSTSSVADMWETALADGSAVLAAAIDVIAGGSRAQNNDATGGSRDGGDAMNRLRDAIGNLSYETGLPCDSGLEIRFAEPYGQAGGSR